MKRFLEFPHVGGEEKRRRVLISIFLLSGILLLLLFASYHFLKNHYLTAFVDVLASFALSVCLVRLQNTPSSKPIFRIVSAIIIVVLLYLLTSEGEDGSTILWLYVYPVVAFLFFGKKEGLLWITSLFVIAMVFMFFPPFPHTFHYEVGTKMRFPVSYILVSLFSYYIEAIRLQTHVNLLKEKNTSQKYLDVAGVMLTVLDSEGKITLINQKGCEILNMNESEAIGENWFEHFLPQESVDEVKGVFSKLMAGEIKPVEYYENQIITKSGNKKTLAFHNTMLADDDGIAKGILFSGEDITARKLLEEEREGLITKLTNALDEIKTLQGILPICSYCKNIQDEKGQWNKLEMYIHNHSDAEFSHSICPKCTKEHYPELAEKNGHI